MPIYTLQLAFSKTSVNSLTNLLSSHPCPHPLLDTTAPLRYVERFYLAHTFEPPNADVKIEALCLQVSGILIVESRC
jgi:hypothetical protein